MGYMGFGMRKEAYTRKPKEFLRKVKPYYGHKSAAKETTAETTTTPRKLSEYERELLNQRWLSERRRARAFSLLLFLGTVAGILFFLRELLPCLH